jgi:predicted nucleic acid-binding protein
LELEQVSGGVRVFVDAPIFVYHFTGLSVSCRRFLERCERAEVQGVTSVTVIAEVTHRLMMIEAVQSGLASAGNVAAKLRRAPVLIRSLRIADQQAARIPLMGLEVLTLDLQRLVAAAELRRLHGLMTNDSIIAATARGEGISIIATSDRDFERVEDLSVFGPGDLPRA